MNDKSEALHEAIRVIKDGGIAAFPTETFYGLGARYDSDNTLKRLYAIKQRPTEKAIPLIIGKYQSLEVLTPHMTRAGQILAEKFWPGPLTLLVEARKGLSPFITAGTGKVAVRIPGRSFALDLAQLLIMPITATSANISGLPPADNPDAVAGYFGESIDLIIHGDKAPGGAPSTIVDVTVDPVAILREGRVPTADILASVSI